MKLVKITFPIKGTNDILEQKAVEVMMSGLSDLVKLGALKGSIDDFLQNYEFDKDNARITAEINSDSLVDPSKLATVGSTLSFSVDASKVVIPTDRQFSATSIQERLRISGMNPKVKFRYTILDYKKFYNARLNRLKKDPDQAKRLKNMFLLDTMGIFTEVLPYVKEGKQLTTLTGLNSSTKGMNSIARELSLAYRRALKQSATGQLTKPVFQTLKAKYTEFMDQLILQVFPGINELIGTVTPTEKSNEKVVEEVPEEVSEGTESFSEIALTGSQIKVEGVNLEGLYEVISKIKDINREGQSISISITDGEDSTTVVLPKDLCIYAIHSNTVSKYKSTDDGRIDLFS